MQGMGKNKPFEKKIDAKTQVTLKNAPTRKFTEKKM